MTLSKKRKNFAKQCTIVRRFASGEEVWQCMGHDCTGSGHTPTRADLPPSFRDLPLKGLRMVECFAGIKSEGGASLSEAWGDAGGISVPYDIRINELHDFMSDDKFWAKEENNPASYYHFAIPCETFSIARTTPSKIRNLSQPLGWGPEAEQANKMMRLMIRRIQRLVSKGACVTIENPLMSYLWKIEEMQGLMGSPGFNITRADHCTYGTPYQKPQIWCSNCPKLTSVGSVCLHREPHLVRLEGKWTRRSNPYPRELALAIIQALVSYYNETGKFCDPKSSQALKAHLIEGKSNPDRNVRKKWKQAPSEHRPIKVTGFWKEWAPIGDLRIEHCKKGILVQTTWIRHVYHHLRNLTRAW